MKIKKTFNYNILKINKDEIIFINFVEINVIMTIMNDKNEKFLMKKKNYKILKNKINDYIKKHHNNSLLNHLRILKTL